MRVSRERHKGGSGGAGVRALRYMRRVVTTTFSDSICGHLIKRICRRRSSVALSLLALLLFAALVYCKLRIVLGD